MITRKTAKVVVSRIICPGALDDVNYHVIRINGPADVQIPARTSADKERTLVVGDRISHDELKRLCSVQIYDVTAVCPDAK